MKTHRNQRRAVLAIVGLAALATIVALLLAEPENADAMGPRANAVRIMDRWAVRKAEKGPANMSAWTSDLRCRKAGGGEWSCTGDVHRTHLTWLGPVGQRTVFFGRVKLPGASEPMPGSTGWGSWLAD